MAKRTIKLPPLQIWSKPLSFGRISHVLRAEEAAQIERTFEVQLSPRRKAEASVLSNGETVVITPLKNVTRPPGVHGLLAETTEGGLRWISHEALEQFEQKYLNDTSWDKLKSDVMRSWNNAFSFRAETPSAGGDILQKGLRPPQLGALHAVGAHWSINNSVATIVMPTGTGKTETMLATLVCFIKGTLLVVVPSKALRDQTARKFERLGLLRDLSCITQKVLNPVVAVLTHRIKDPDELKILQNCNVLVATINTVAHGEAAALAHEFSGICSHIIFDEAHHVPAATYSEFRDFAKDKRILQYTATPFRRDGKELEGKTIFSYPLSMAQEDGYFRKINFKAVFELREKHADELVAKTALAQLKRDLSNGLDHLMMARCKNAKRAKAVFEIYKSLAADLNPVLVLSEDPRDNTSNINKLRRRQSKIVVCVNMLGEGFDLPELKVAAIHDTHKSIAILLQFAGRFTRDGGPSVGEASVIANIAEQTISTALERLYDEDSDWNKLLSEFSSEHIKDYTEVIEFIRDSRRIDPDYDDARQAPIRPSNMRPTFSVTAFRANTFSPEKFVSALSKDLEIHGAWINEKRQTLYFVTEKHLKAQWAHSKTVRDIQWDLFIVYFNKKQKTLFIHCSDNDVSLTSLADAVASGATSFSGDEPFRAMSNIQRLMFQNIGLKKPGRRNLRYSMYSGADVVNALSAAEKATSVKANASATGYAGGAPVTIACSAKGKVWSRTAGRIPDLLEWCDAIGAKLNDSTIDVDKIIANLLIPELVKTLPPTQVFCIDWPNEFNTSPEYSTKLTTPNGEFPISQYSISFVDPLDTKDKIQFAVRHSTHAGTFELKLEDTAHGFKVTQLTGPKFAISKGKLKLSLDEYFSEYPPSVLYVDGSELDGCYHIKPSTRTIATFPTDRLVPWDWSGVSIKVESMWHNNVQRTNSIQEYAAEKFKPDFDVVFDDDDDGEAADLVLFREHADEIEVCLVHCKFSGGATPGARVKDVVEVSTQAVRSSKRIWKFKDLIAHLYDREKRVLRGRTTRFLKGTARQLAYFRKLSRHKNIRTRIIIVQPGLSKANISDDQSLVLSGAQAHLLQTVGVDLEVYCSS